MAPFQSRNGQVRVKGESFQSVVFSTKLYSALLCKAFSSVAVDGSKELGSFCNNYIWSKREDKFYTTTKNMKNLVPNLIH